MGAAFTYAVRYQITAACRTPLRTGGADGDTEAVLRDGQGLAVLQGASLAGALRAWLKTNAAPELVEGLMGSQRVTGRLIVSDALFDPGAEQYIRPRLRIDPATGAAALGRKFDVAHIGAGANLCFSLTWLGDREHEDELEAVEQMLAALHSGEIRLGAQKSNGFGWVKLTGTKQTFDMKKAEARDAWLDDNEEYECVSLHLPEAADRRRVIFTVTGRADSILVRSPYGEQMDGGSCTPNLTEGGRPVLPGSSVKGAVRARAEAIAGAAGLDEEWFQSLFGRDAKDGDNGRPGQIWFEDARLDDRRKKITRIRINKFTGGVIRGGLFQEEPVNSAVTLRISMPGGDPAACALVLYALRDLGMGLYSLGSGGAIGRGYVAVRKIEATAPDGKRAELVFDGPLTCSLKDPDGLVERWLKAWGGAVREN